jgi:RNA polymerase sigma-70 factor, ECF subfamily
MKPTTRLASDEVAHIYRQYQPLLSRRCRALMPDRASADDVLQEAFVKILRHGAGYRTADRKLPWLYRVVENCCFDARKRRYEPLATPYDLQRPDPCPQVDMPLRIAACRALDRLGPEARRLAVLALVDGLSQEQIGAEVGVSRQTVHKKMRSIRRRLARYLGGS